MLRVGEIGKPIYIITSFAMQSNTSLTIKATPPSGVTKTWTAELGGALTNVTLEDGTIVASVPVNESMFYTPTSASDLDESGVWELQGIYENTNAAPDQRYISTPAQLTVEENTFD